MTADSIDLNRMAVERLQSLIHAIRAGRALVQGVTAETQSPAPAKGQPAVDTGVRVLCVEYRLVEGP